MSTDEGATDRGDSATEPHSEPCSEPRTQPRSGPPRWVKLVVSGLLLYHLAAIVAAPAAVPPSSMLFGWLMRNGFRHYAEALYLDHGYQFFAPEIGPSTLVSYTATTKDGEQISERFPNTGIRPRLLYHRHFMLTERMRELGDDGPPSYARHLLHKYDAERVGLTRVTHLIPSRDMVAEGATLTDPRSYEEQPLGVFQREQFQRKEKREEVLKP